MATRSRSTAAKADGAAKKVASTPAKKAAEKAPTEPGVADDPNTDGDDNPDTSNLTDDESTTPEQVRQEVQPLPDKVKIGIETVIAGEPSAAQAYIDGWTQFPPQQDTPEEATTSNGAVLDDLDQPTTIGVVGLNALLQERKDDETVPETVVPRTSSAMPTIPLYHAQAALAALNAAANGNPTRDEENHAAFLAAEKAKSGPGALKGTDDV